MHLLAQAGLGERLHHYFQVRAESLYKPVACPPFTLYLHPSEQGPDAHFAMPNVPLHGEAQGHLAELTSCFTAYGSRVRIAFLDRFAPELPAALQQAGLHEVERSPVLACTAEMLAEPPAVPGLTLVTLSSGSPLELVKEGWNANALGYDLNAELATDEEAEAFRRTLTTSRAFIARLDGQMAGAGMFEIIAGGVTELVGITTLAPYRRRGIAAYLTASATRTAFAHGADLACLVPENDEATRVYTRLGFQPASMRLVFAAG